MESNERFLTINVGNLSTILKISISHPATIEHIVMDTTHVHKLDSIQNVLPKIGMDAAVANDTSAHSAKRDLIVYSAVRLPWRVCSIFDSASIFIAWICFTTAARTGAFFVKSHLILDIVPKKK